MNMNIRKIILEEMDWVGDVPSALPDNRFLNKPVPFTITVRDYLNSQYSYDFIDIILEDGRVIELTMEGDWDVKYQTYPSLWELVETQGLSNPWIVVGRPIEFNQGVMEDYLREFNMEEVRPEVAEVLRKVLPLDIKGIYTGSL
jgi:membrane protease subunit (stomatin/prohibitin family)